MMDQVNCSSAIVMGQVNSKSLTSVSDGFEALHNHFDSPNTVLCNVKPPPRTENGLPRDARFQLQHFQLVQSRPSSAAADWSPSTSPPSNTPQPLMSARASSTSILPAPVPRRLGSNLNTMLLYQN